MLKLEQRLQVWVINLLQFTKYCSCHNAALINSLFLSQKAIDHKLKALPSIYEYLFEMLSKESVIREDALFGYIISNNASKASLDYIPIVRHVVQHSVHNISIDTIPVGLQEHRRQLLYPSTRAPRPAPRYRIFTRSESLY